MSLDKLEQLLTTHGPDLLRVGVQQVDLEELTDSRVDYALVVRSFDAVVVKLTRWHEVRGMAAEQQWLYFEATNEVNVQTRTLAKAAKEVREAFRRQVHVFYREALKVTS